MFKNYDVQCSSEFETAGMTKQVLSRSLEIKYNDADREEVLEHTRLNHNAINRVSVK